MSSQDALEQLRGRHTPLDSLPLPICIELPALAKWMPSADPADALMRQLQQNYRLSERVKAWVREKLPTAQCWLILDALDEVDEIDRPPLNRWLKTLEGHEWQCLMTLTCRTASYDRALVPWRTLTEYPLARFCEPETLQFIERWFGPEDERGKALRHALAQNFVLMNACRNPLILTLTCLAHEEREIAQETLRVDLYPRILRGLAGRAWKENPLNSKDPHIDDLLCLIEPMAQRLFEQRPGSNRFTNSEVIQAIQAVSNLPHVPTLLREELCECGILVGAGLNRSGEMQFSFLHHTFLEYLTASALAQREKRSGGWQEIATLVGKKAGLPAWWEVIVLLAGKLDDPLPLLKLLRDKSYNRNYLALTARCLSEIRSGIRNSFVSADACYYCGSTNDVRNRHNHVLCARCARMACEFCGSMDEVVVWEDARWCRNCYPFSTEQDDECHVSAEEEREGSTPYSEPEFQSSPSHMAVKDSVPVPKVEREILSPGEVRAPEGELTCEQLMAAYNSRQRFSIYELETLKLLEHEGCIYTYLIVGGWESEEHRWRAFDHHSRRSQNISLCEQQRFDALESLR